MPIDPGAYAHLAHPIKKETTLDAPQAYAAYSAHTGNKNFRGEEMPAFDDLPEGIKGAWRAALVPATAELRDAQTLCRDLFLSFGHLFHPAQEEWYRRVTADL